MEGSWQAPTGQTTGDVGSLSVNVNNVSAFVNSPGARRHTLQFCLLNERWRKVKKIITARQSEFEETLIKLLPLIGANELIESLMQG